MTMRPNQWIILAALFGASWPAAKAQIPQDRPELCGSLNPISLPEGLSAVPTQLGADMTLRLLNGSSKTVELRATDEIRQICPLDRDRLLVFGVVPGDDGYIIWILRLQDGSILDTIGTRSPALSPDRRWLIYRQRYPTQSELRFESYLLYDLAGDAAANRSPDARHLYPPGRLVYPVTEKRTRLEDLIVSPDQYHEFPGPSFFWSADSKAVAFTDRVGEAISIVVIRDVGDEPTAYVQKMSIVDICSGKQLAEDLISSVALSGAYFNQGTGDVLVEFSPQSWMGSDLANCRKSLTLNSTNLKRAGVEPHRLLDPPGK